MWFRIVSPIREAFNRDVTEEPALEEERASTLSPADFQRVRLVVPTIMEETSGPGEILLDQDMMREPIIEKDLGHGNCDSSSTKGEQEQILSTFAEVNHATTEPTICINANSITVISHQAAIAPPSSGGHSLSIDPAGLSSSNYYSTSSRYSDGYRNGNSMSPLLCLLPLHTSPVSLTLHQRQLHRPLLQMSVKSKQRTGETLFSFHITGHKIAASTRAAFTQVNISSHQ